jgi:hypothetical protein
VSSAAGGLVDLHSQWESIAFLDANIIGSGSATMIGSASADIGSQVGMESIGLGVL